MATTAQVGSTGITFGGTDAYGVTWKWNPPSAKGAKPGPREETTDRAYGHGQTDATRFYGPRTRDIPGTARARSHQVLHEAEQRLRDAIGLRTFPLTITEPGFVGVQYVRQSGEIQWTENTHDDRTGYAHATFSVGLYAADPLIYAVTDQTFTLALPQVTGGRTYPRTLPGRIGASSSVSTVTLNNPSSEDLWRPLMLHVVGPATRLVLGDPDTGRRFYLDRDDGRPLLADGEYLDIDTGRHRVWFMGQVSRRKWAHGDFLTVRPGQSRLTLNGVGGTGPLVTGSFTPARL